MRIHNGRLDCTSKVFSSQAVMPSMAIALTVVRYPRSTPGKRQEVRVARDGPKGDPEQADNTFTRTRGFGNQEDNQGGQSP